MIDYFILIRDEATEAELILSYSSIFYTLISSSWFLNIYISQDHSDNSNMKDPSTYTNINNKNRKKSPAEVQQSIKFNLKALLNLKITAKLK